ncbi:MAG TPA: aquaporin [Thermoplasmata archaeon]|nr:aquaporin [Thermoplasmata archaeon]
MEADWWKKGIGELIGAFTLVVGGAGSVLASNGNQLYAAFGHAFSIAVMGTALGAVSGGQISPAVTLGLVVTRHQKADIGAVIIVFQLIGSLLGGFLLRWLYPSQVTAGLRLATPAVSGITPEAGMLLELVMTFLVVFVVFATAIDPRGAAKTLGAIPIGLTVGIDWLFGGGFTGAAMSPGRWLGPAVASGFFDNWWVYWAGPLLGGILGAVVYEYVFRQKAADPST